MLAWMWGAERPQVGVVRVLEREARRAERPVMGLVVIEMSGVVVGDNGVSVM